MYWHTLTLGPAACFYGPFVLTSFSRVPYILINGPPGESSFKLEQKDICGGVYIKEGHWLETIGVENSALISGFVP